MVDNMNYIELAQECQLIGMRPHLDGIYQEALKKFAELVAAEEREACAKICDDGYFAFIAADIIRERGKT